MFYLTGQTEENAFLTSIAIIWSTDNHMHTPFLEGCIYHKVVYLNLNLEADACLDLTLIQIVNFFFF